MDAHEDPRTTAQLATALERAISDLNYLRSLDLVQRLRVKIGVADLERARLRKQVDRLEAERISILEIEAVAGSGG